MIIVNCYLPCSDGPLDTAEYLNCLSTISHIANTNGHCTIIVGGDLNADITSTQTTKRTATILKNFIDSENLISLTARNVSQGDYTYMSDDGNRKSIIDDFLIPAHLIRFFEEYSIFPEHPLNASDHRLVRVSMSAKSVQNSPRRPPIHTTRPKPLPRLKITWPLISADTINLYTTPVEEKASEIIRSLRDRVLDECTIDQSFQALRDSMIAASLSLPHEYRSGKPRGKKEWSEPVKYAYKQAHDAWKAWKAADRPPKPSTFWSRYLSAKKHFRRTLRQSKAFQQHQLHKEIETASSANSALFYRMIKGNRKGGPTNHSIQSLEVDGETYSNREVINGWEKYFRSLATEPAKMTAVIDRELPTSTQAQLILDPMATEEIPSFTSRDLVRAISSLKKGKASGGDNITAEHIIHTGPTCRCLLLLLLNACLVSSHTPQFTKEALILPLHKGKGKPVRDPSNYRGISLTSSFSKLIETLVKPHLERPLRGSNIPDELQFGFQCERSCMMTSASLQLIIELNTLSRKPTFAALLDAQKAFDCVWHDGLLQKLSNSPVHPVIQALLASSYDSAESRVYWEGKVSLPITLEKGVRQGSILSPSLYILFIDGLIKALRESGLGCTFQGRYSGVIVLADDVALLAPTSEELQKMLRITGRYTIQWRYSINPSKSVVIVFNEKRAPAEQRLQETWSLSEAEVITRSHHHPHLGITKSASHRDPTPDIISKGLKTFFALQGVGTYSSGLSPYLCAKLWTVFCIPRMLYGTAVLTLTTHEAARLNTSQNNIFKKILGLPQSTANDAVYLLVGLLPLPAQHELNSLLLIGQLTTLPQVRFEKRTLIHATTSSTPLTKAWNKILTKHSLPDLTSLLMNPIPYMSWKRQVNKAVQETTIRQVQHSIRTKSTLSLWKHLDQLPSPASIFPLCLAPHLRKAQIARCQLLTQTYPTQKRLLKIGKTQNATCPLCKEEEDVVHFISSCNYLLPKRASFIAKANQQLPQLAIPPTFDQENPLEFARLILLPNTDLATSSSNSFTTLSLYYILQIHTLRASAQVE